MRIIVAIISACTVVCALVVLGNLSFQPVSAEQFRTEATGGAEALVAGGSCGGSCGPAGSCGSGETIENNCASCSSHTSLSGCKCGTGYICYNSKGKKVGGGGCTGSCTWTKKAAEVFDPLLSTWVE